MELPFQTVDVFTRDRFRGNPLAVVTIPANLSHPPTQEQKQAIAREFNLSETVFVHDIAGGSSGDGDAAGTSTGASKTRRIDIFLTNAEIPFAGHPTIGAAVTLLPQGVDTLVTKAGPIKIVPTAPDAARAAIPHNVHLHGRRLRDLGSGSDQLSPHAVVREAELSAPVFSIVQGMTFLLVELPSVEVLGQVPPTTKSLAKEDILDAGDWCKGFIGRYFFAYAEGSSSSSQGDSSEQKHVSVRTRMIEPGLEDPATGSAACALSAYLTRQSIDAGDKFTSYRYEVTQGVEMGRESNILVGVSVSNGQIDQITLEGAVVQVMRGHVRV